MAERAKFTFEIVSHPKSAFSSPEVGGEYLTSDEYLEVATGKFDLSLQIWLETSQRAFLNLKCP